MLFVTLLTETLDFNLIELNFFPGDLKRLAPWRSRQIYWSWMRMAPGMILSKQKKDLKYSSKYIMHGWYVLYSNYTWIAV